MWTSLCTLELLKNSVILQMQQSPDVQAHTYDFAIHKASECRGCRKVHGGFFLWEHEEAQ